MLLSELRQVVFGLREHAANAVQVVEADLLLAFEIGEAALRHVLDAGEARLEIQVDQPGAEAGELVLELVMRLLLRRGDLLDDLGFDGVECLVIGRRLLLLAPLGAALDQLHALGKSLHVEIDEGFHARPVRMHGPIDQAPQLGER